MESRRTYSPEFKQEASHLTKQAGDAITQGEKDWGLNATMLGRWCREAGRRGHKAFLGTGCHNSTLLHDVSSVFDVSPTPGGSVDAAVWLAGNSRSHALETAECRDSARRDHQLART
ncbi:MAG: transposase [Nitrospirales bacterium]